MSNPVRDNLRKKVEDQFIAFQKMVFEDGGKLDRLLNSGAIDLSEEDDSYKTASKINMALGTELSFQYDNLMSNSDKKEVKNFARFL